MTTSESEADFFTKRIDWNRLHNKSNRIDSNRKLECSTADLSRSPDTGDWGGAEAADDSTRLTSDCLSAERSLTVN